jgi:hypothetical protein
MILWYYFVNNMLLYDFKSMLIKDAQEIAWPT